MGPYSGRSLRRQTLALAISAVLYGTQAQATEIWTGPANGTWSKANNWQDGTAPLSGQDTALRFEAITGGYPAHNDLSQFELNALDLFVSTGQGPILSGTPIQFRTNSQGVTPSVNVHTTSSLKGHASLGLDFSIRNDLGINVDALQTLDLSGTMTGSSVTSTASVVKLGAGTLALNPTVVTTLIRPLQVQDGVVSVATDKSLPREGVTLEGGTLSATQDIVLGNLLSLGAAGGAVDTGAHTVEVTEVGGTVTTTATLSILGSGTLALTAASSPLPMEIDDAILRAGGNLNLGPLSLGAAGGVIDTGAHTVEIPEVGTTATSTATLSILGSGTLALAAASSPLPVEINDAILRAGGNLDFGPLSLGAAGGTIDTGAHTVAFTDVGATATTTAALSVFGSGTLALAAASGQPAMMIDGAVLSAKGNLNLGPLAVGAAGGGIDTAGYDVFLPSLSNANVTTQIPLSVSAGGSLSLGAGPSNVAGLAVRGTQFSLGGSTLTTTGDVEASEGASVGGTGQLILHDGSVFLVQGTAGLGLPGGVDRFAVTGPKKSGSKSTSSSASTGSRLSALALMPGADLTLGPGSTLNVDLGDPLKDLLDQFLVSGSISIDSAVFAPILRHIPRPGETLFLVDNDGTDPIQGMFAGLPDGALLDLGFAGRDYRYQLFYQGDIATKSLTGGNDLVMLFRGVPEPGTLNLLWLALPLLVVLRQRPHTAPQNRG